MFAGCTKGIEITVLTSISLSAAGEGSLLLFDRARTLPSDPR